MLILLRTDHQTIFQFILTISAIVNPRESGLLSPGPLSQAVLSKYTGKKPEEPAKLVQQREPISITNSTHGESPTRKEACAAIEAILNAFTQDLLNQGARIISHSHSHSIF